MNNNGGNGNSNGGGDGDNKDGSKNGDNVGGGGGGDGDRDGSGDNGDNVLSRCLRDSCGLDAGDFTTVFLMRERCRWGDSNLVLMVILSYKNDVKHVCIV